jgi:hypothetical protein
MDKTFINFAFPKKKKKPLKQIPRTLFIGRAKGVKIKHRPNSILPFCTTK